MASDLSTIMTNQTNDVNLYVKGMRSGSVLIPNSLVNQPGYTPANPQPLTLSCLSVADSGSPSGTTNQLQIHQGAWCAVSTPVNTTQSITNGTQLITINGANLIGQNVAPTIAANTVNLDVYGYYKVDFSFVKDYSGNAVETVANIGLAVNGTNAAPLIQCPSNGAGMFMVSGSSVFLSVGGGFGLGFYYTSNVSAGTISITSFNATFTLISSAPYPS